MVFLVVRGKVSQAVGNVRNIHPELCLESMTDEPPKAEEKPAEQAGFEF
jgi:hypothetical protein